MISLRFAIGVMSSSSSTGDARAGGRRERGKQAKLRRIRRAAAELFAEKGFEATTTREIAARADVGAGTLFLYVPDKQALLWLVYEETIAEALQSARGELEGDGPLMARLHGVFVRLFEVYAADVELSRHFVRQQVFGPATERSERLEVLRRELYARMAQEVVRARSAGEVAADVDPQQVAASCFSLYFSALTGWLGGFVTREQALAALRGALELQYRGMRSAAGVAQ
jgi:TetR/AcrR family transcriptional regulator, cholesterol catabolism regulator